jgi:hypothetical protein
VIGTRTEGSKMSEFGWMRRAGVATSVGFALLLAAGAAQALTVEPHESASSAFAAPPLRG